MTRDEIRGLIGGYATNSLTDAERSALFEAALADQELFDELAREQTLKQLLEEPGVKARIVGALAPRPRAWWAKAGLDKVWAWAAAGAFAIAVITGILLLKTPPQPEKPQEIAQVTAPEPPVLPAPVAPKKAPSLPVHAPQATAQPQAEATPPKTEPAAVPAAAAPLPPPAPPNAPVALGFLDGGRGGGQGGGGRALAQRSVTAALAPARFAFDYSVTPEGALRIVPASNGFLTVGANNGSAMSVLFSSRPLQAGSVTEVPLPADCVSALVIFSAREMPAAILNLTGPVDEPSGTKSDPSPTPDSRLIATVPVKQ
jgi:hypothetical protein